jgi:hypothetical protein
MLDQLLNFHNKVMVLWGHPHGKQATAETAFLCLNTSSKPQIISKPRLPTLL